MKHTGAKNRRYTDDCWQSVPTRARFLCFWGDTPGRQFCENSRERARRSPETHLAKFDHPLARGGAGRTGRGRRRACGGTRRGARAAARGEGRRRADRGTGHTAGVRGTRRASDGAARNAASGADGRHTGPTGAQGSRRKRATTHARRTFCPASAYQKQRWNYRVSYLAIWTAQSDVYVAGRKTGRRGGIPRGNEARKEHSP